MYGGEFMFDEQFLLEPPDNLVKDQLLHRMIVIDTANIMCCSDVKDGLLGMDGSINTSGAIADASALLVVVRYFYQQNFDVHCFASYKYANNVANHAAIQTLISLDLLTVLSANTYDDHALLTYAEECDGVVLSRDQFKFEKDNCFRLSYLVDHRVIAPRFEPIQSRAFHWKHSFDGHFATTFRIGFNKKKEDIKKLLYCKPSDGRYEIVQETRAQWSETRRDEVIAEIDRALEICKKNPTPAKNNRRGGNEKESRPRIRARSPNHYDYHGDPEIDQAHCVRVMNVFRLAGDMSHLIAILILLTKIWKSRSVVGISAKSQILFSIVFIARYLDLFTTYLSLYNSFMKVFFISSSLATVYLMFRKFRPTYEKAADTFRLEILIVPCAVLALFINHQFEFMEVMWTFSIYLEAVAIMPQLFMLQNTGSAETITAHYLFALGSYRALYIGNWIYRYAVEGFFDPIAVISGVVQTLLYADFFYIYATQVMPNKGLNLPK